MRNRERRLRWIVGIFVGGLVLLSVITLVRENGDAAPQWKPTTQARTGVVAAPEIPDPEIATPRDHLNIREPQPLVGDTITVLTVDDDGATIAEAELFVKNHESWECLGKTDASGSLSTPVEIGADSTLVATATGYAMARETFEDNPGAEITVVLSPGGEIRGSVVFQNGDPVGSGIHVVAYEHKMDPSDKDVADAIAGYPSLARATTNEEGEFMITGLEPSRLYFLTAGGKGLVSGHFFAPGTYPNRREEKIVVGAVYGAVLRFRCEESQPLEFSRDLVILAKSYKRVRVPYDRPVFHSSDPGVKLAGVTDNMISLFGDGAVGWFVLADDLETGFDEPIRLDLNHPGYNPEHVEIWLHPISSPEVYQEIVLTPVGGFGEVNLRFVGNTFFDADAVGSLLGAVVFSTPDGIELFGYPVRVASGDSVRIRGCPYGAYSVRFLSRNGRYQYPSNDERPISIVVGPEGAYVTVVLDNLGGGIHLVPRRPSELPPAVRISNVSKHRGFLYSFSEEPYVIRGLEEGEYEIRFDAAIGVREMSLENYEFPEPLRVFVRQNEVSEVVIP